MNTSDKIRQEFQERLNENPAESLTTWEYMGQLTRFFAEKHAELLDRFNELEKPKEIVYQSNKNPNAKKK